MSKKKKKFIQHDIENDYYVNYSEKDGRYRAILFKTMCWKVRCTNADKI